MTVVISKKVTAGDEAVASDANLFGGNLNLRVEAQSSPDMTVKIKAGIALFGQDTLVEIADTNTSTITAPSVNPRVDIISLTSTGGLELTTGSENASPATPAIPRGNIPLQSIYLTTAATSIKDTDDSSNGYLYQDLRVVGTTDLTQSEAENLRDGTPADDLHIHWLVYEASDDLRFSANTERNTTSDAYSKVKEVLLYTAFMQPSEVRVKFDLKGSFALKGYGKIYINGVAVGTERISGTTWETWSEDITVESGDLVQLYYKANNPPYTAYVKNFRIYYNRTSGTTDGIVNTD